MPLYANINGARKEIIRLYANIGGASREINTMYANIDGVKKNIFTNGEKFYTMQPSYGSEVWSSGTRFIGRGFTVNPGNATFTLTDVKYDATIHRGELYVDDFVQSGSTLKWARYYAQQGGTIDYLFWKLDFGSDSPNVIGTAYSADGRGGYIGADYLMYIRTENVTFYRWRQSANSGGYWYRTFDTTPDGYDASTKTIL